MASSPPSSSSASAIFHLIESALDDLTSSPSPSPGYFARAIVLWCLLGLVGLLAIGLLGTMAVWQREKLWAFRLVKRDGGRYIVSNSLVLVPLFALALLPPLCATIATQVDIHLYRTKEAGANSWTVAVFPILFLGSWLWSCSGLQAFLLVSGPSRRLPLGPRTANSLFLGGLVAGLVLMLAISVIGAQQAKGLTERVGALKELVSGVLGRGSVGEGELERAVRGVGELEEYAEMSRSFFTTGLYIFAVVPFCIGFINLGTVALILRVRRQLVDSRIILKSPQLLGSPSLRRGADVLVANTPKDTFEPPNDQVRRVKQLENVHADLLIACLSHYLFICTLFGCILWVARESQLSRSMSWSETEAIAFLPSWICGVFFSAVLSVRLFRCIRHVVSSRQPSLDIPVSIQPPTVMHSLAGLGIEDDSAPKEDSV